MRKLLVTLAACLALSFSARADVILERETYNPANGDFALYVHATEPWIIWRSFDLVTWERVGHVQGVGHHKWTDVGIGRTHGWAFYQVTPKGHGNPK